MSPLRKPKVLIFASHYLPGYKAGGPIKSIANAVDTLLDQFDITVVTRDRDLGARKPYEIVKTQRIGTYGGVNVHYLSPGPICILQIRSLIQRLQPDLLYLNSFFDPMVTTVPLLLRRLGLLPPHIGIAMAPRGEFSPGALAIKPMRKRMFLRLANALDLHRDIVWQATAEKEVLEIRGAVAAGVPIILVIPDPPALAKVGSPRRSVRKSDGVLRLVFLARISRMKNLDGALQILMGVKERVDFSIYGPVEDAAYWGLCQRLMGVLPANVQAKYCGPVLPEQVSEVLGQHDLLFLPTLGENFGHVICEAWASGCPVLISDNTPWRALEERAVGWDVSLTNLQQFREIIDRCVRLDPDRYDELKQRARAYEEDLYRTSSASSSIRALFSRVLEAHRGTHIEPVTQRPT